MKLNLKADKLLSNFTFNPQGYTVQLKPLKNLVQRWNGLNKMAQLNKMAFCPKICPFIRKGAIIMTWLQIKIVILLHICLKCSRKLNFGT